MAHTIIEKIISRHSALSRVKPGDIADITIDARVARDFGGANVVKNIRENNLGIDDRGKTFFTFDCNPTGSDQKYAVNQHICRQFARDYGIKVYDINAGIGTHLMIENGLVYPGATAVSTDSHANILGAIGAFGQGMGDKDIAAVWAYGKTWFKVPETIKIILEGKPKTKLSAKDIVLNMLGHFGANGLLGCAAEIYGELVEDLTLDQRVTIASMATEMGAIILLFRPNREVMRYCESRTGRKLDRIEADPDARYADIVTLDASEFEPLVSRPGKPHDTVALAKLDKIKIDSAFIGSCTNGRIEDMRKVAAVLKNRNVAPGVVLKIVPATDKVWHQCLEEGIMEIFKEAGALVSNAGCAGCAAGQVGQNGPGEVTVSTGNRNFPGKQGKGEVYLASPATVAASAVAGYIVRESDIPDEVEDVYAEPGIRETPEKEKKKAKSGKDKPVILKGRSWYIQRDNVDTDMIYHNRYLSITDMQEMGQYTFDNLEGYGDFASESRPGDIVFTGKNFGSGSSRQQAVDCFKALGIQCIVAESFGAIYERNAVNAAFPIMVCKDIGKLEITDHDKVSVNLKTGEITNPDKNTAVKAVPFPEVQMDIYQNGGVF